MIAYNSALSPAIASLLLIASLPGCDEARSQNHRTLVLPASHKADTDAAGAARAPDTLSYAEALRRIASRRDSLATRYGDARTGEERAAVLEGARSLMLSSLDEEIFPYWYGTPWDFNGTTETPGMGSIACGYFVTTVLRDAGLHLARVKLAQQASESIIRSLTGGRHIQRFSNMAIAEFVEAVRAWGPGVYIVGLDIHVGFIVATESEVYFVHASYVPPRAVVKEIAVESRVLTGSKYRVLGKISADDALLMKWLLKRRV